MLVFRRTAAFAVLALLASGCLTSEGLLFDAKNAKAAPLEPGAYDACQREAGAEPDCKTVAVSHDASGLYKFAIAEENETTFARFKAAGTQKWAAQLWSEGDDDPFYFLAWREGAEFALAMIDCETLPASYKKKYVARKQLEVKEETTCVARTAGAVVAAAKAWSKTDAAKTGSRLVYTKK